MRPGRLLVSLVAAAALVPLTATAALAAPPGNDDPSGATPVTLGQTVKEDTSQATTDKIDAQANRFCGAPYTNASVWFSYTPSDDGSFILNMKKSDYSGGFMVFVGKPKGRDMVTCGPEEVGAQAQAGTTYLIMAFSDTKKNGGNLVMSLKQGPPPPTLSLTVDPKDKTLPKGQAQLSGTYTCTNGSSMQMVGELVQVWRRVKITGQFGQFLRQVQCDGQAHAWTHVVKSHNGLFAPGQAIARVFGEVCGPIDCADVKVRKQVTLVKGSGPNASAAAAWTGAENTTTAMHPALLSSRWPTS